MLAEKVREWGAELCTQAREQGRREARQEGRRFGESVLLLRLMEERFGPLDDAIADRVRSADAKTLLRRGLRLFTATSPGELVAD